MDLSRERLNKRLSKSRTSWKELKKRLHNGLEVGRDSQNGV
jgi:hypothetical protein